MFRNIIEEALKGNFSFAILITNIGQLGIAIAALIVAIKAFKKKG